MCVCASMCMDIYLLFNTYMCVNDTCVCEWSYYKGTCPSNVIIIYIRFLHFAILKFAAKYI